ncbi:MAG: DUF3843 family protein [Firmicutes bacterium]|nr:DUF3843 family protein [Bacillota bacterium]MCM1400527.1 DUF3843 family protein [Bacteroides sp.]MCM1476431.1 DUF3843 family protein [Bacteroides sp.]
MKKIKKILIPILEWKAVHLDSTRYDSDIFYASLARELANGMKIAFGSENGVSDKTLALTAIDLAAYLQDKVDGLNMWNSFIALYRKEYGREFPFYNVEGEEILNDEPNLSDIRFLLWRGLNRNSETTIVNPSNPFIAALAERVFETLCDAYEQAPETPELRELLFTPEVYEDPILMRNLCGYIGSKAYLTRIHNVESVLETASGLLDTLDFSSLSDPQKAYFIEAYISLNLSVGPMNLPPYIWLAQILELSGSKAMKHFAENLRNIKSYTIMPCVIKEVSENSFTVLNPANETMEVSFTNILPENRSDAKVGHGFIASLYFYNGYWQINGISTFTEKPIDYTADIENYAEAMRNREATFKHYDKLLNGNRIGTAPDYDSLLKTLGIENIKPSSGQDIAKNLKSQKNFVYFLNSDGQITILPDAAQLIKLPDNNLYDVAKATALSAQMFLIPSMTAEMRQYIFTHNLMPDARLAGPTPDEEAKAWFRNNCMFLAADLFSDKVLFNMP